MQATPRLNPELRAALIKREAFFGSLDLSQMSLDRARAIELNIAEAERDLMPNVRSAVEITLPQSDTPAMTALWVTPDAARHGTILYIHGGGWALGSHLTHEDPARRLAVATGMNVLSVSYRLAPEHPFPAGLNDCVSAWRALLAGVVPGHLNREPFLIAGDSAGANLAVAVMLNEIELGAALPDAAILFYGVYGADFLTESYTRWADGPVLTRTKMRDFWDLYCPQSQRSNPRVQPLLASAEMLQSLPPLYLAAAEVDPLLSDSEQFFGLLSKDKTRKDVFDLWRGLAHGSLGAACYVADVRAHIDRVGKWVRDMFPVPTAPSPQTRQMRG